MAIIGIKIGNTIHRNRTSLHASKVCKDLDGRLEFFVWDKRDGTSTQVLAVGVATDDDLAGIAQEEQDASFAECTVVATLEHNRTGRRRINYLWRQGEDTYTRASYESVTRWYRGLWEEQVVTGGTTIQMARSTRILNILEGHEKLDQAMTTNLDPRWVQTRQAAHRDATIQALKREASYLEAIQDPKKRADRTPTSGDDTRAPRPSRRAGTPKRHKDDDDSYGSEEDSSCEQRQIRPRKVVKLPVMRPSISVSPEQEARSAALVLNTNAAHQSTPTSATAATSSSSLQKVMAEERKTARRSVSSTLTAGHGVKESATASLIKTGRPSAAAAASGSTKGVGTQKHTTISPSIPQSSTSAQLDRTSSDTTEKSVLYLRSRLQLGFLSSNGPPKHSEMNTMAEYFSELEQLGDLEENVVKTTKIHKVLKAITKLANIPKNDEHKFKARSVALLAKWQKASEQASTPGPAITAATTPILPAQDIGDSKHQDPQQTSSTAKKEALKLLTEASSGLCEPEAVQLAVQTLTGQKPPLSIIQRATFARVVTRIVESIYDFQAYRQWFEDNEVSMMDGDSGAEAM